MQPTHDEQAEAGSKAERAAQERAAHEAYAVNREDDRAYAVAPHEKLVAGGGPESHSNALKGEHLDAVQDEAPPSSDVEAYSDYQRDQAFNHSDTDALDLVAAPAFRNTRDFPIERSTEAAAAAEAPAQQPEASHAVSNVTEKFEGLGGAIAEALSGLVGAGVATTKAISRTVDRDEVAPPSANPNAMDRDFVKEKQANTPVLPRNAGKQDPKA